MTALASTFTTKVRENTGCHIWIGATNNRGYGVAIVNGDKKLAHRVSYEAEFGPIADGLVLDHLCRVRNCVNPMHLEPVTTAENNRRGRSARGLQVGDFCQNAHFIDEGDLYFRASGATECRLCRAAGPRHGEDRKRPTRQRRAPRVAADLDRLADTG